MDLNQKYKCIFNKMFRLGKCGEQTGVTLSYHRLGCGGDAPQPLGDFFVFFGKKTAILMPIESHFV